MTTRRQRRRARVLEGQLLAHPDGDSIAGRVLQRFRERKRATKPRRLFAETPRPVGRPTTQASMLRHLSRLKKWLADGIEEEMIALDYERGRL